MKHLWLLWLAFAVSVVTWAGMASGSPTFVTVIGAIGATFVVLVAQGNRWAPLFGIGMAAGYGLLAQQQAYYGDMAINWFYHLPMYVFALFAWSKASTGDTKVNKLNTTQWMMTMVVFAIGSILGAFILMQVGGAQPFIDSVSTTAALIGTFLLTRRYADQWEYWTIGNSCGVILWGLAAYDDVTKAPLLIMWIVFLLNGLYGWYKWTKPYFRT